jgi:hypothetical protein
MAKSVYFWELLFSLKLLMSRPLKQGGFKRSETTVTIPIWGHQRKLCKPPPPHCLQLGQFALGVGGLESSYALNLLKLSFGTKVYS